MVSLEARLVNIYLKASMKPKPLHLLPPEELRTWFEARRLPLIPKGATIELVETAQVAGEWARPAGDAPRGTLLFLHGGGYMFGSPRMYRTLTARLALAAKVNVFAPRYPLSPESRCPAAIEAALVAYDHLLRSGLRPCDIVFGGDSAGGGLALATLQAIVARGLAPPAGALLYSPWTDLTASGASIAKNAASDCMFQEAGIRGAARRYAGALDLNDPRASPLYGSMRGLPPMLVFASSSEMLFDDSVRLVERARAQGVDVRFEARGGLTHVWPLFAALMPEGKEAVRLSADFIRERIAAAPAQRNAA